MYVVLLSWRKKMPVTNVYLFLLSAHIVHLFILLPLLRMSLLLLSLFCLYKYFRANFGMRNKKTTTKTSIDMCYFQPFEIIWENFFPIFEIVLQNAQSKVSKFFKLWMNKRRKRHDWKRILNIFNNITFCFFVNLTIYFNA